jgi:hypothetical protein
MILIEPLMLPGGHERIRLDLSNAKVASANHLIDLLVPDPQIARGCTRHTESDRLPLCPGFASQREECGGRDCDEAERSEMHGRPQRGSRLSSTLVSPSFLEFAGLQWASRLSSIEQLWRKYGDALTEMGMSGRRASYLIRGK